MKIKKMLIGIMFIVLASCAQSMVPDVHNYFGQCMVGSKWSEFKLEIQRSGASIETSTVPDGYDYRVISKAGSSWFLKVTDDKILAFEPSDQAMPAFYRKDYLEVIQRCAEFRKGY